MLWFSIPAVIILASIPVLIIVSQIEGFQMRKYFTWTSVNMMWCFLWACFGAFRENILFTIFMASVFIMWCHIDSKENGEY
jgi:hypothetical protein